MSTLVFDTYDKMREAFNAVAHAQGVTRFYQAHGQERIDFADHHIRFRVRTVSGHLNSCKCGCSCHD